MTRLFGFLILIIDVVVIMDLLRSNKDSKKKYCGRSPSFLFRFWGGFGINVLGEPESSDSVRL